MLQRQQIKYLMPMYPKAKGYSEAEQHSSFLAGALHNTDWEIWQETRCRKIIRDLESKNIDWEFIHAIASHDPKCFGVEPETDRGKSFMHFMSLVDRCIRIP
jgi:hypothetical protein